MIMRMVEIIIMMKMYELCFQDSFDKGEDPIHVVNVCIKCEDVSLADQEFQREKFCTILQNSVSLPIQ